jgi:hypothetical protein
VKKLIILAGLAWAFAGSANAQDLASMQVAQNLGSILGSERACELAYDQAAIEAFIEEKVEASDMSFASQLNLFTDGMRYNFESMTDSQKTAHCAQIRRVAKNFSFIE